MAKSGSMVVEATPYNDLKFEWSITSQSIVDNTSTVAWSMKLRAWNYGAINSTAGKIYSVTVNGKTWSGAASIGISNNSSKTLASGSLVIEHDPDGRKTFEYSFYQRFDITFSGATVGKISGSGSGVLDAIPRASQPSCITWPEHTQNVGYFGDEISIHMNRASTSLTHTVRYQFGSQSGTIATGVETGVKWVIPLSLMNLIPSSTKGSGTIYVDTYAGSSLLGTKYCGFTATVPNSVKPTCSISVSDPTGCLTKYGSYVQGLSKFSVSITATGAYSSTIKSYEATANGSKYTAKSFTTAALKASGTMPIAVTVTDSRGRKGTASKDVEVMAYTAPIVSKLTVGRCEADGTANEQGAYVQVTFSAKVTALNNKNTAAYKLRYKKTTDSNFSEVSFSALNNNYSVTDQKYVFEAETGNSYDVEVVATDNHSNTTRATSASTAFTLMHFGADGTSLGIFKVAEKPNALDLGGDIYLNNHAIYGTQGALDTRDANENPLWYMTNHGMGTVWEFKRLDAIGFTSPSVIYGPMQTIIPWKDASGGLPRQVVYEGRTRWTRIAGSDTAWGAWQSEALIAYPVGSIYIAYNHTNPGTLFGGTWERLTGGFLWASQPGDIIGQTGGESTVTLTAKQIPAHNHGGTYTNAGDATKTHAWLASGGSAMAYDTVNTGGGEAHNNMPPYIQVSIWRRTA